MQLHRYRQRRRAARARILASLFLAVLCAGCAGPRPQPATPRLPGYEALRESLKDVDTSPVQGRRIVLDPGHGGHFRGALGPNGLAEADVNLGVALYLRGLLEWAGAEVWLTRTADTDFLTPADSSLAGDLAMRVSLSDSLQPDVFISIHHNSNASLDRTINETQTYYPLDDDGASLDLARAIHRHLVVNLEIQPASIRPGNFHVLRNATVPAVLGEPAMISHPVMARRLSLASSQRLEAEAYFLGLCDYFSGGLPAWSGAARDTVFWGRSGDPTTVSWHFLPDSGAAGVTMPAPASLPGPDPAQTVLTLDGRPVAIRLSPDARTVSWDLPSTLAPAEHTLELRGRNLAGRATPQRHTVLLPSAGTNLQVDVLSGPPGTPAGLHWHSIGGGPLPVGRLELGAQLEFPVGPDAPAWALVADPAALWPGRDARFRAAGATGEALPCPVAVDTLPAGRSLHLVTYAGRPYAPADGWRPRLGVHGGTPLVSLDPKPPFWLGGAGVQPLIDPVPGDPARPRTIAADSGTWEAVAVLPGLLGRVIVLDPAGGDTDTDGSGPLGLRGADLNLAVARQTAALLRGAGAQVHLTRDDETALPAVEKVRLSERLGADLFLTIGRHEADRSRSVRHHPGSVVGRLWAAAAVRASALLPSAAGGPADTCRSEESASYLLRHTACPALAWLGDPPADAETELRLTHPGWHRAEARALLLAIAAVSGHPAVFEHLLQPESLLAAWETDGGLPGAAIDWALIDGNLPWSPLPPTVAGSQAPESIDSEYGPGLPAVGPRHVIEVHAAGRWQLWLLTAAADRWQATRILDSASTVPR